MIDRFEILASRIRYFVSRNRWSARLLGYESVEGHRDEPGLVLVQVDGLGEQVLERALGEGKMPFLRHLLEKEGHERFTLYSGMTSNTPNFQGELFYGLKSVVPSFGFRDRETGREMVMNAFSDTATIERRLAEHAEGLLAGGSAWSDVFVGGAAESHLCASTAGLGEALRALNPWRLLTLVVWHGWSVVRVAANFLLELLLALIDFLRGAVAGRHFRAEFKFIGERVAVTAVMREIVTAGACIDAERGLPIIHMNFLGYDEHAHRRGPDSRFALWTLRGIDKSLKRIWMAVHRSPRRDYQVWVYSDHGQEPVESYWKARREDVSDAIRRCWEGLGADGASPAAATDDAPAAARSDREKFAARAKSGSIASEAGESGRSRWLREPDARGEEPPRSPAALGEPQVIHRGPVGFVYLPEAVDRARLEEMGRAVAGEAGVPMVLARDDTGAGAVVWTPGRGPHRLPEDAAEVFGDHPHREEVTADILRVVHHESAGDLVLMGWNRWGAMSFKIENGAHGSAGPRETSGYLVMPPEMAPRVPRRVLRAADLRALVSEVMNPEVAHMSQRGSRDRVERSKRLRVMTYNVHFCRGMDGRYSTQRIARVIARAAPDVVCLQEVDQSRTRSGGVDQGHEIARQLEKDFHFHAIAELDDGHFGNAVLSSLPLRWRAAGPLPALRTRLNLVERGVLWVEVEVDGMPVQVLNTHLSISERERRLQIAEVVGKQWLGHPDCSGPVVLAGDFNASPESRIAWQVESMLRNVVPAGTGGAGQHTWSSRFPVRRIDHVFTSSDLGVHAVTVPRSRLSKVASDHLPVIVDLEISRSPVRGEERRGGSERAADEGN